MSSPFSTIEDFNSAVDGPTEGAIYTFANSPLINNIALLLAVGIFLWFITNTYTSHTRASRVDKSMNHLSSFIVVGLLSLVTLNHWQPKQQPTIDQRTQSPSHTANIPIKPLSHLSRLSPQQLPAGLLGMIGLGSPAFNRSRNRRKSRSLSKYRTRR